MEDIKKQKAGQPDPLLEGSELMSLVELQKFLSDEISGTSDSNFSRAFMPITDGLGLENPKSKEPSPPGRSAPKVSPAPSSVVPDPEPIEKIETAPAKPKAKSKPAPQDLVPRHRDRLEALFDTDPISPQALQASLEMRSVNPKPAPIEEEIVVDTDVDLDVDVEAKVAPQPGVITNPFIKREPPPLPAPSATRRLACAFLDQVFALTLFGLALAITSHVMNPGRDLFSMEIIGDFTNPQFVRFAALEFTTIWLTYFAVGIGLLDMTFGMWVWGMRIAYQGEDEESRFFKKFFRTLFSFFFYAPIAPMLLLAIRWKGRNFLDRLSGTLVYQSAI